MTKAPAHLMRASQKATREALARECERSPSFQEWFKRANEEANRLRPTDEKKARTWEKRLAARIKAGGQDGRQAREELIIGNIPLTYGAAAAHLSSGAPFQDLLSATFAGLCKAAMRYKSKRARFSTFASPVMLGEIQRLTLQWEPTVRLPVHVMDATPAILRARQALEDSGESPTVRRLSLLTGHSALIVQAVTSPPTTVSYDAPTRGAGGIDMTPDDATEYVLSGAWDPDDAIAPDTAELAMLHLEQEELHDSYAVLLSRLPPRQRQAVMLSYGLDEGGYEREPAEVGRLMGVTPNKALSLRESGLFNLRIMLEAPFLPRKRSSRKTSGKKSKT